MDDPNDRDIRPFFERHKLLDAILQAMFVVAAVSSMYSFLALRWCYRRTKCIFGRHSYPWFSTEWEGGRCPTCKKEIDWRDYC